MQKITFYCLNLNVQNDDQNGVQNDDQNDVQNDDQNDDDEMHLLSKELCFFTKNGPTRPFLFIFFILRDKCSTNLTINDQCKETFLKNHKKLPNLWGNFVKEYAAKTFQNLVTVGSKNFINGNGGMSFIQFRCILKSFKFTF